MSFARCVGLAAAVLLFLCQGQLRAAPAAANGLVLEHMESGGLKRQYWIRVPQGNEARRARHPLIIVLHGGGGTGESMAKALRGFPAADRDWAILVYPDAYKRNWNDGEPGKIADDVAFLTELIDDMVRTRRADAQRVSLIGISNGAAMASRMLCERAGKLAAVAMAIGSISETIYPDCRPSRPVSVMMINGTADPIIRYEGGAVKFLGIAVDARTMPVETTIRLWARSIGADPDAFVITTLPATEPDDGMPVRLWRALGPRGHQVLLYKIENAGHTWPDGPQYAPKWLIGKVKRGMDATQLVWDFLMRQVQ